jgi:hypothetical protein
MSFLRRLFGSKPKPPSADSHPADAAGGKDQIQVFDRYGRELFITRSDWEKKVLPHRCAEHVPQVLKHHVGQERQPRAEIDGRGDQVWAVMGSSSARTSTGFLISGTRVAPSSWQFKHTISRIRRLAP